jgi:two-component system KDP operon response regulator KdpE
MSVDDRARRARAGAARGSAIAPAARTRNPPPRSPRPVASATRVRGPRYTLAHHDSYTRWTGDLVLVVTEDVVLRRALCHSLATQGYRPVEADASSKADALVARIEPKLILLDLDRSDGGGLACLVRVREVSRDTPIIALSVRADEGDKVAALDVGADDFMTKPLGTSELLARIRAALRHARTRASSRDVIEIGPIRIDHGRYEVSVEDKLVHLTPIEFRLLAVLARHAGKVVPRDQLLGEVWGPDTDQAHYLRVYVAALRQKLEKDPAHPRWLVTVTGMGYRLRDA